MSVEELVKLARALPPNSPTVAAVTPSLSFLDSRALAAFLKELAKVGQAVRSLEVFDWLRGLPSEHELAHLCDVYTYTTAISLMSASQQLRRALELVGEMRSRGLACNVHTYSALMNVCIKVSHAWLANCSACMLA
jgi:pentatricopeptide repeat domain-containing protein 1